EADALQPGQEITVQILRPLGEEDMAFPGHRKRDGHRDEVAILQGRTFAVERVRQLRARLDVDDQGRAALDERDLRTTRMQVLRDIVPAVAGADNEDALSGPRFAVAVLAGVQHHPTEAA